MKPDFDVVMSTSRGDVLSMEYNIIIRTNRHHIRMDQVGVGRYDDIGVLMIMWGNTQMTDYGATATPAENHKKVPL